MILFSRALARNLVTSLVLLASCFGQPSSNPLRTEQDVIKGIDLAAYARENNLAGYTVQEKYDLFRRGDTSPSAEVVVATTYAHDGGKNYKTLSESGSGSGKLVLHKILQNERQVSQRIGREDVLITSRNYQISVPDLNEHDVHGRKCLAVSIKPKKASPYLLDGTIWVDSTSYHIVRLEGKPSADPSMLSGRPWIERDYTDVDGFPVAVDAKSVSKQRLLGETVLLIKYDDYRLIR